MNKEKNYNIVAIVWSYLIASIVIISTGGAWLSDVAINFDRTRLSELLFVTLVLSFFVLLFFYHKLFISRLAKLRIFIVAVCMVAYRFVCQSNTNMYDFFFMYTIFLIIACMSFLEDKRIVWSAFVNVVTGIAIISLFFYIGGTLLQIIPETGVTELLWGTWDTSSIRTFFHIYYESQSLKINETQRIFRNCGIFTEAPMYNFVLCMALNAELFISKKANKVKCFILIITILTTLSTTGFLFLIFTGLLYWFDYVFSTKKITVHKIAFGIAFLGGILMMLLILVQKTFSRSGRGSLNVRTDHFFACIRRWFESPLYGCGYLNKDAVLIDANYYQGLSVGFVYLLACGGILLTAILIIPYLLNGINALKTSWRKEFFFETLFMVLYFFTALTGRSILPFIISYIAVCDDPEIKEADKIRQKKMYPDRDYNVNDFYVFVIKKLKIVLLSGIGFGIIVGIVLIIKEYRMLMTVFAAIFAICIGVLFAIFVCYILFVMRDVFYSADEFRTILDINILGVFSKKQDKKLPEKFAHFERDHKYKIDSEKSIYETITKKISVNYKPRYKILLMGTAKQETLDTIRVNLSQLMPEICFVTGMNVNTNIDALRLLSECDSVIFVEYEDFSKLNQIIHEKKTVDYFKKDILGAIIYS